MEKLVVTNFLIVIVASYPFFGDCQRPLNVVDFGAVGDGRRDDSQAFLRAWKALCEISRGKPLLQIPSGKTFLLQPVQFLGPCRNPGVIQIQVLGNIVAPDNIGAWATCPDSNWLKFSDVNRLSVDGSGKIDGQGLSWWKSGKVGSRKCKRPNVLRFQVCNSLRLQGLNNSPRSHMSINGCNGVFISNLRISAPKNSPNTDGIDIASSKYVNIQDSFIGTGDDCIAINGNVFEINITRVTCGPGHGISVGSLGKERSRETVDGVHVKNCTFNGTMCGARIKTWPGGSGYARHISFEDIILINAGKPIIIDQHYPDHPDKESAVAVRDVTYRDFRGTSSDKQAITLDCDSSTGCHNTRMEGVKLTSSTPGVQLYAFCKYAFGTFTDTSPKVSCQPSRSSQGETKKRFHDTSPNGFQVLNSTNPN